MTTNLGNLCGEGQFAKVYRGQLYGEEIAVKVYPAKTNDLAMVRNHYYLISFQFIFKFNQYL